MDKRYDNLQSVMNLPKGTPEEQREFINAIFEQVFYKTDLEQFHYDKHIIKRLYYDHNLVKSNLFCEILTKIFSQPYQELGYYHGDDGTYVENFPPIRIHLTQQQAFELRKVYKTCEDYKTMIDTLSNTTLLMKDETKSKIKHEIYDSYKLTLTDCMLALSKSFNISINADKKEDTLLT